jgi:diguanylate cyclase (GGDEF)-like protein
MSRVSSTHVLVAVAVLIGAGSIWTASQVQQRAAASSFEESHAAERMLVSALEQEAALRGFALTGHPRFVDRYRGGGRSFDTAVREAAARSIGESAESQALDAQTASIGQWHALGEEEIARVRRTGANTVPAASVIKRERIMDRFRSENHGFQEILRDERHSHLTQASWISLGLMVVLAALLAIGYLVIYRRGRLEATRQEADRRYRDSQSDFTETLQVTRSEPEAYELLKRHLERSVEGSQVVVLNRNNSDNRLEAATPLPGSSPLSEKLKDADPSCCLAVRLGRRHEHGATKKSLLECELCGALADGATCVPSLVGGEVIGSVLVNHRQPLDSEEDRRVQETVTQAAPVLANLRNLELARIRAATDALTGLGNTRTARETLKRMIAQAGRTVTPMSAVLVDLDHFKRINDTQGHGKGDEALAAVGDALSSGARESDFVGRYGGEEFLVLLPATDREGAAMLAENLRQAIAEIKIPLLDLPVTASFGVATYPADAGDAETLLRVADRALYRAKDQGRNRVEVAAPPGMPAPDGALDLR